MSYKDLQEARARREVKDRATAKKGKRGRKRKIPVSEEEAEANSSVSKGKMVRMSEVELTKAVGVP